MKHKNTLFILSNGKLAAINKKDGNIIWDVKLKEYLSAKITFTYAQIIVEDDKLFIGSTGILLCLNAKDGTLIWKNELKGWGYHFLNMANSNNAAAASSATTVNNAAIIAATI